MSGPAMRYRGPGVRATLESTEGAVQWGDPAFQNYHRTFGWINGNSRDESNTPTTILRPGLLMSWNAGTWVPYDSGGVGSTLQGVFSHAADTQLYGQDENRWGGYIIWGGPIKIKELWTNDGTAGAVIGHAAEAAIRAALELLGFKEDDWYSQ